MGIKFEDIKGLGASRIKKLREAGFVQPLDLLLHFPYAYADMRENVDFRTLSDGDAVTVRGEVAALPQVRFLRKGLRMTTVALWTDYGNIEAVWFNIKYIVNALPQGKTVYLRGKIKKFRNKISLSAPRILQPNGKTVVPLYRPIAGVPQKIVDEAVDALLGCADIRGYIPSAVRQKYRLPDLGVAFREIHRPHSATSAESAARVLSVEKLSYTLSMFRLAKDLQGETRRFIYADKSDRLTAAVRSLPFALTEGQSTALHEIVRSLHGEKAMNRLLQGDVGCGKTAVALLTAYYAYLSGHQSVLMAPTELLARQHYRAAISFLEPLGLKAVLLCGSMSKSERENALFALRTHSADLAVGTHALLGPDVLFHDLSLIITDEQQRFGVGQRGALENKAPGADTLVMTATPIPRTLALCMYGELEQSSIRTMPQGRAEISTSVVPPEKIQSMYEYLAAQTQKGEQCYIVCPRIEADEEENLTSAEELYAQLHKKFPHASVGLLHGKMRDTEKESVMEAFRRGEVRMLVATTVVEVGVDVPAATGIVICNPERYGLSQLHQLRGRVGRGEKHSYCFLPTEQPVPERLRFFCRCRDGFALAEYDFTSRGAGDFIGTRQHGDSDDLPTKIDAALIELCKSVANDTLADLDAREKLNADLAAGADRYVRSITMN